MAIKDSERLYIQVADDMPTPETQERELAPLRALRGSYPKLIIARKPQVVTDFEGIRVVPARDFFLDEWRQLSSKQKPDCGFKNSSGCFGGFMKCLPGIHDVILGEIP